MLPRSQLWLLVVLAAAGGAAAFSGRMDDYVLDVALGVCINITLAVSLNLINGFTGQFSLGHAGFMAVGAYTAATLTTTLGAKLLPLVGGQPWILLPIALLAGGLAAAVAGFAVGTPSLRLKGDYLAIVTLGFGEIIKVIFQNVDFVGGALGLHGIRPLDPTLSNVIVFSTLATAALTVYFVWGLLHSTYGRGFLAVADDEIAAESMGLNTTRYKITAFVVGAFFAGVAGGLYAHTKGTLTPGGFDFTKSIEIVVMVILGGMGRHVGVIIAAVLLSLLPEALRELGSHSIPNPFGGTAWSLAWIKDVRMIMYSLLLIVLMLTRPQGLFTWSRKNKAA